MSRLRTPHNTPDPRHRYHAMMAGARAPVTQHEFALDHLLHGTDLAPDFPSEILDGVKAALHTYDVESARRLFDACILGLATEEELEEAFSVSALEASAYLHLFFDRTVFHNGFHIIAYIAAIPDEGARALMKEAHTKGFRAIRFKYAADRTPASTDEVLLRMLEADSHQYLEQRGIPLADPRAKDLRALGKQIITNAQALGKVAPLGKNEGATKTSDEPMEFVIQSGPLNPTLDELLSKGVEIIH